MKKGEKTTPLRVKVIALMDKSGKFKHIKGITRGRVVLVLVAL